MFILNVGSVIFLTTSKCVPVSQCEKWGEKCSSQAQDDIVKWLVLCKTK